jgi:hypothetical protein
MKMFRSSFTRMKYPMENSSTRPSKKSIILVGLVGCFLTSLAGVTGAMLLSGFAQSGGWAEWLKRLSLGYPCACVVVLLIFPHLVPTMTAHLESR